MAIFQAVGGYRDPAKSMTIKALEARLKAAQEASASSTQMTEPISDPMQGAGYLMNVLAGQANEYRAEKADIGARDQLAKIKAGIDWNKGPDAGQYAEMSRLDPEGADKIMQDWVNYRQDLEKQAKQNEFTTSERVGTQGFTTSERVAGEGARSAEAIADDARAAKAAAEDDARAVAEAQRKEGLPQTDVGKIEQDYRNKVYGEPGTPEAIKLRDDAIAKANAVAKGASQNVYTGENRSEFDKKNDQLASARFDDLVKTAQGVPELSSKIQQLNDLSKSIRTGKGAEIQDVLGPWAQWLGVDVKGQDKIQAFKSIASGLAPHLRVEGSGTMSNFDAQQLIQSIPTLGNTPQGNAIINATLQAVFDHQLRSADIANRAQRGLISWQDADREIAKIPYPYEAFKKYMDEHGSDTEAPAAATPDTSATPAPAPATTDPEALLKEARDAIAKGADPAAVKELLQQKGGDPSKL